MQIKVLSGYVSGPLDGQVAIKAFVKVCPLRKGGFGVMGRRCHGNILMSVLHFNDPRMKRSNSIWQVQVDEEEAACSSRPEEGASANRTARRPKV